MTLMPTEDDRLRADIAALKLTLGSLTHLLVQGRSDRAERLREMADFATRSVDALWGDALDSRTDALRELTRDKIGEFFGAVMNDRPDPKAPPPRRSRDGGPTGRADY